MAGGVERGDDSTVRNRTRLFYPPRGPFGLPPAGESERSGWHRPVESSNPAVQASSHRKVRAECRARGEEDSSSRGATRASLGRVRPAREQGNHDAGKRRHRSPATSQNRGITQVPISGPEPVTDVLISTLRPGVTQITPSDPFSNLRVTRTTRECGHETPTAPGVYILTGTIDGKFTVYVGKASRNIRSRVVKHHGQKGKPWYDMVRAVPLEAGLCEPVEAELILRLRRAGVSIRVDNRNQPRVPLGSGDVRVGPAVTAVMDILESEMGRGIFSGAVGIDAVAEIADTPSVPQDSDSRDHGPCPKCGSTEARMRRGLSTDARTGLPKVNVECRVTGCGRFETVPDLERSKLH